MGFALVQELRDGTRRYSKRANPYLAYWLRALPSGEAELTWEFSLGQYLRDKGFFVSGQDELSLLLFPRREARGTFEAEWVTGAVARAERELASLDFVAGR